MINSVDTYFIDHFFGSQSAFLDHLALTATNSLLWVPFYVLLAILVIKNHDSMSQIAICVGCAIFAVLFATGLTSIVTKPLVERLRPCNDPEFKYLVQIAGDLHNKDFSFFSSHAATTMALATFFSFLVRSGLMTCSMFLWSLLMCWTRLYLGQHFFTDILVGITWGVTVGIIFYLLYLRFSNRSISNRYNVSERYTVSGFYKYDIEVIVLVQTITFLYCLIPL